MDSLPDESLFLISTSDPCYGDLILYLQTQQFHPNATHNKCHCIHHHVKQYLIVTDTLHHRGIDTILRCWLTHEDNEIALNDCHSRECGGHLYGLATIQKILRAG